MTSIMGIDLSLTGTGVVVVDEESINASKLIKSKPSAERTTLDEIERLLRIKADIIQLIDQHKPKLVLIEGLAFMAKNTTALVQLAGLNYMIREYLAIRKIPFVIVAPTTLKKFIIGKGVGQKDLMLLETYKKYGVSFIDDNLCDAFALATVGVALKGENKKPLAKYQVEVLNVLSDQYEKATEANKKEEVTS